MYGLANSSGTLLVKGMTRQQCSHLPCLLLLQGIGVDGDRDCSPRAQGASPHLSPCSLALSLPQNLLYLLYSSWTSAAPSHAQFWGAF